MVTVGPSRRKKTPGLTAKAEFLTVDLDIRSRRSLAPIVEAWPWVQTPARIEGRVPRWVIASPRIYVKNADAAIRHLVLLIDALPRAARRCWTEASSRTFDIGIQAGLAPSPFEDIKLREDTVKAVARLSGRLLVTIYAPYEE